MATFGERLKQLRISNNLKQSDIANIVSISERQVSRFEHDENSPNLDVVSVLADYFSVSIDYLVGVADEPEKNTSVADETLDSIKKSADDNLSLIKSMNDVINLVILQHGSIEELQKKLSILSDINARLTKALGGLSRKNADEVLQIIESNNETIKEIIAEFKHPHHNAST